MGVSDTSMSALEVFTRARDALKDAKSNSIIEYTRPARVEPIVLLDDSLRHHAYMTDVLQTITSIFSGYYLQAISLSCNVGSIDTLRLLDKMNPNRSPVDSAINSGSRAVNYLATEAYAEGSLPGVEKHNIGNSKKTRGKRLREKANKHRDEKIARQDKYNKANSKESSVEVDKSTKTKSTKTDVWLGSNSLKDVQTNTNLSVGKMLEVNIDSNGSTATIPVNVRLIVKSVVSSTMAALLTNGVQDTSVKERFHRWQSGELRFVQDLIMCQDIIDNHKKALMADRDGSLRGVVNRSSRNRFSALISGDISIASASSILIVSRSVAREMERMLMGKLKDFRIREKLFHSTCTMLMVVVDTEWEQVEIYHRSIHEETTLSIKEVKNSSSKDGPNISDILSAYKLGTAPSM